MGIFLNPGKERFLEAIRSQIYVDKTEMISVLNAVVGTKQKYFCVSRPRRFGKTMAIDMLCAYYGQGADSRECFEPFKLAKCEQWDRYLGKFNVISVAMTRFLSQTRPLGDSLRLLQKRVLGDLHEAYPEVEYDAEDFIFSLEKFYQKTNVKFVVIIDEWDAVFREFKDDTKAQREYLDFLRDWLKDQAFLALAYMTGILPVKKYGKHSALNMFREYSMLAPLQLAPFTGFTTEEVQSLCKEYHIDFERIREWYDGYRVRSDAPADEEFRASTSPDKVRPPAKEYHLYAPLSVVEAVTTGYIKNYWNNTETYEALAEYIRADFDGLKEIVARLMDGAKVPVDLRTYQNDMQTFVCRDDILALLIHLGYLGYEEMTGCVFIPNREILDEYYASTKTREWASTIRALKNSQELLEATWAGDEKRVAELVEAAHDKAGNRTYNSEAALSYAVQLAYYKAQDEYTVIPELDTGKGYADLTYIPKHPSRPALLIELKHNLSADSAIDQILRQDYPSRLEHYKGNLILVGINYDKSADPAKPDFKHHSCRLLRA